MTKKAATTTKLKRVILGLAVPQIGALGYKVDISFNSGSTITIPQGSSVTIEWDHEQQVVHFGPVMVPVSAIRAMECEEAT